jgi:hypothetical protein
MLVVFEFESADSLSDFLGVVAHGDTEQNEEMDYCVNREHAGEILACRELKIPYVVVSKKFGFGDKTKPVEIIDTNTDVTKMSLVSQVVMRVNSVKISHPDLDDFPHYISESHDETVKHWPRHLNNADRFLQRTVVDLSRARFNEMMAAGDIRTPVFIKGVEKGSGFSLHHVLQTEDDLHAMIKPLGDLKALFGHKMIFDPSGKDSDFMAFFQMPEWYCPYRDSMEPGRLCLFDPEEGVMLSEVLTFERALEHKGEYRAFIVDGKVTSLSSYTDYVSYPVPEEIQKLAEEFAQQNTHLAPSYVADFGITERGPVLIELNSLKHSGRYIGNDPQALFRGLEQHIGVVDRRFICEPLVGVPEKLAQQDFEGEVSPERIAELREQMGWVSMDVDELPGLRLRDRLDDSTPGLD